MTQRVNEQIGTLATIEPESHFVQIGREMLGADLVPRSDYAALEQRERRLNCVRCDASAVLISSIFFGSVVDGFVAQVTNGSRVGREIVSDNYLNIFADIFSNVFGESVTTGISRVEETEIAATLPDADNN